MRKKERNLARILAFSGVALCCVLSGKGERTRLKDNPMAFILGANLTLSQDYAAEDIVDLQNPVHRVANRLRTRILSQGLAAPFTDAVAVVTQRRTFLKSSVHVTLQRQDGKAGKEWIVGPQRFPLWIVTEASNGHITTGLSHDRMMQTIAGNYLPMLEAPVHSEITDVQAAGDILRTVTANAAKPGYVLDIPDTANRIRFALENNMRDLVLAPEFVAGAVINTSGMDLGELTLIGAGSSNFAGSPAGRVFNVRKALREHINNVVVLPGKEFSFNATLGGPVSERRGWKLAKVISAGELVMEPGGGICQTSTTLYRGILEAGLPVGKRKSHSMYISYYEKGGVGLDATVYYGHQDLTFTNDTGHPVVIQSFDEGDDAFVYIYGTPDGRTSTVEGPFFSGSEPEEFGEQGRRIKSNEIGWLQRIEHPNGIIETHPILSTYKALPKSIVYKYTAITAR